MGLCLITNFNWTWFSPSPIGFSTKKLVLRMCCLSWLNTVWLQQRVDRDIILFLQNRQCLFGWLQMIQTFYANNCSLKNLQCHNGQVYNLSTNLKTPQQSVLVPEKMKLHAKNCETCCAFRGFWFAKTMHHTKFNCVIFTWNTFLLQNIAILCNSGSCFVVLVVKTLCILFSWSIPTIVLFQVTNPFRESLSQFFPKHCMHFVPAACQTPWCIVALYVRFDLNGEFMNNNDQ